MYFVISFLLVHVFLLHFAHLSFSPLHCRCNIIAVINYLWIIQYEADMNNSQIFKKCKRRRL